VASQAVQTLVRADNAVGYFLPSTLGGIYGQAQYAFGEGNGDNKYAGGRIGYAAGPLNTAIAYGQTWTNTAHKVETWDGGATYEFGRFKLFGQFAYLAYDQWDRTNYLVGATVPVGAGYIRAAYTYSEFDGPACAAALMTTCEDAQLLAIGYVHDLSKRTALYTTAALLVNGANGALTLPGGPNGMRRGENSQGVEAGIRHNF
jgi:predicted porin